MYDGGFGKAHGSMRSMGRKTIHSFLRSCPKFFVGLPEILVKGPVLGMGLWPMVYEALGCLNVYQVDPSKTLYSVVLWHVWTLVIQFSCL